MFLSSGGEKSYVNSISMNPVGEQGEGGSHELHLELRRTWSDYQGLSRESDIWFRFKGQVGFYQAENLGEGIGF